MLNRQTLAQVVTADLLSRITAGEFNAGDRLPSDRELMATYGVGRNTAREATQALATMGWITVRPGLGAIVNNDIDRDVHVTLPRFAGRAHGELMDLLVMLEAEAVRLAARSANEAVAETLEAAARHVELSAATGQPTAAAHAALHRGFITASGSSLLADLHDAVMAAIVKAEPPLEGSINVEPAHDAIIAAIRSGDGYSAADLARRHLRAELGVDRD